MEDEYKHFVLDLYDWIPADDGEDDYCIEVSKFCYILSLLTLN